MSSPSTALTMIGEGGAPFLTAHDMKAHVRRIREVVRAVMKEGVHFGTIPGTDKPSLLKPGAEVLCATFRIAPSYDATDLSDPDCIRYRVVCIGTHQTTSIVLGQGMGEASSSEEKYKWKRAGQREYEAADADRRRIKYGYNSQKNEEYEIFQVRTNPADVANTVLKMACKRAQVAMTLNVTAAGDCFTQDLEDLPEGLAHGSHDRSEPRSRPSAPKSTGASKGRASERQVAMILAKLTDAGIDGAIFAKEFDLEQVSDLPWAKVDDALNWIKKHSVSG